MDTPYEKRPVKKKSKDSDSFCKITVVQLLACAFMVLLLAVVCRLSPDSGVAVKNRYDKLMSNSISLSEVWASAKEVAYQVFKPVDTKSVQSNAQVKTTSPAKETTETDENEQETTPAQSDKSDEPQTQISSDKTAAVMSFFSDDAEITAPVHGRITSYFGSRTDPISGENGFHRAIDIAVDEGTSVAAAWDGIVTKTGYDSTRGNYLWMVHKNGCETFYCHCSKILVEKGAVIRAGESVALSGDTGYSTGPHLHFAVKKDGEMQDPLDYLTQKDGRI